MNEGLVSIPFRKKPLYSPIYLKNQGKGLTNIPISRIVISLRLHLKKGRS